MLLIEYIEQHYGKQRGNKTRFLRDNEEILPQELSRWLKAELKINIDTGEIYKPTSKSIAINRQAIVETSGLSQSTNLKLKTCAERVNLSTNEFINYLLDDEVERNQLLALTHDKKKNESNTPVQVIAEVVNRHFSVLSRSCEMYEYHGVLDGLVSELLEKKLLSMRVPENSIAESQRLKIPRIAYYWYGAIIADRIAKILGTFEVYLWHEMLATDSEVVFIGSPNNVVASYLICEKVCRLLKQTKSAYKKDQGNWGKKSAIEEAANDYMYNFAQGVMQVECYIYDEDSQMRIIEYASEKYRYAMR